jgi:hypothetical protein
MATEEHTDPRATLRGGLPDRYLTRENAPESRRMRSSGA